MNLSSYVPTVAMPRPSYPLILITATGVLAAWLGSKALRRIQVHSTPHATCLPAFRTRPCPARRLPRVMLTGTGLTYCYSREDLGWDVARGQTSRKRPRRAGTATVNTRRPPAPPPKSQHARPFPAPCRLFLEIKDAVSCCYSFCAPPAVCGQERAGACEAAHGEGRGER